jgi:hypothetical protein
VATMIMIMRVMVEKLDYQWRLISIIVLTSNDGREENGSITKRLIKKCKRHHSLDVESMEISGSHPHHHHFKVNYSQMLFVLCFVVEFFFFFDKQFFFSFE